MVTREVKYVDFDGNDRIEDLYFNLNRSELTEWNYEHDGGFVKYLERIVKTQSVRDLIKVVRDFILKAYGEKSPDGKRFVKSDEISKNFYETNAYDALFMSFVENPETFAEFVKAVCPPQATTPALKE